MINTAVTILTIVNRIKNSIILCRKSYKCARDVLFSSMYLRAIKNIPKSKNLIKYLTMTGPINIYLLLTNYTL